MSIEDKFNSEEYLDFHFGRKEQYSRQLVIVAMSRFCYTSTRHLITKAIANRPKEVRQGFQVAAHDSLYEAAIRIKTEWMTEGLITPSVTNSIGAYDIYLKLREGIPEDMITPSMFVSGYGSEQGHKFNEN